MGLYMGDLDSVPKVTGLFSNFCLLYTNILNTNFNWAQTVLTLLVFVQAIGMSCILNIYNTIDAPSDSWGIGQHYINFREISLRQYVRISKWVLYFDFKNNQNIWQVIFKS